MSTYVVTKVNTSGRIFFLQWINVQQTDSVAKLAQKVYTGTPPIAMNANGFGRSWTADFIGAAWIQDDFIYRVVLQNPTTTTKTSTGYCALFWGWPI